jgi:hypothetical protein
MLLVAIYLELQAVMVAIYKLAKVWQVKVNEFMELLA